MEKRIYTGITLDTLIAVRNRTYEELIELTKDRVETAVDLAKQLMELDGILEEHRQREKEKAAKERAAGNDYIAKAVEEMCATTE